MSTPSRRPQLRRQLTLRLMVPLVAIVALVGAAGLLGARAKSATVFDRWLLDSAVSLADQVRSGQGVGGVRVDLPAAARSILSYDEIDLTWFEVEDRGRTLAGVPGIPRSGPGETVYSTGRAFDGVFAGHPVRIAEVGTSCIGCEHVVVLVAETLRKRRRADRVVAWMALPLASMLGVTCWAIYAAVRRTVRPLEAIAGQWRRQSHESLQPIAGDDLPGELAPFASALNDLLARLRGILGRERMFSAAATHQLRTPLTALRLGLARARRSPDLESTRAVLDELGLVTERMGRLVQQLLLLARLDPETSGELERRPTDLRGLAQDICALFAEMALARDIDLELGVPDAEVAALVHADLLGEALANLIDNATKAAGPGGRVLVEVLAAPARLRVCDSGAGVAPAERRTIFERYARGSAASWEGSGLGLAIVRDIAALNGATVEISDSALGGACFELAFEPADATAVPRLRSKRGFTSTILRD